ncbi:MAG: formylmethanofuran dehydrogenase [Firmicutes bacterium ML8_F2]|jgi:formylmethanofuran dehydrogenase subunit E|nr:MAG: formylmethanofuran dehydrogenase [Firmicutes bacterium ML8_F2]
MRMEKTAWEKAVEFHGHVCPGLAIGYKVAQIALDKLQEIRAEDEEMVAIVENDACGIDAIMFMTGCTLGKGNLIFKDTGKQVYTFANRKSEKAIRIAVNGQILQGNPEVRELHKKVMEGNATEAEKTDYERQRQQRLEDILYMPNDQFAKVTEIRLEIPERARLFSSVECACCGEYAMEPRTRNQNGQVVCLDCFSEYSRKITN